MKHLLSLLRSFKIESVDQEIRTQQKTLFLRRSSFRKLKLHIACLIVDVAESLLGNLGHASNIRSVPIGIKLRGRINPARD